MFLRKLIKNGTVTINYYKEDTLYKCKGIVQDLNLAEQTLSLKDQQENILSIRLSKIVKIYWIVTNTNMINLTGHSFIS